MKKPHDPAWSKYQQDVYEYFKSYYPHADIKQNIYLKGKFSKRKRQVDILITEKTPSGRIQIVVEAKHYSRKVDVKIVESFSGFLTDLGIDRGIIISDSDYTLSALRWAHNSPVNLELDILNFSELGKWQAYVALPYVGNYAFIAAAPFGWVIDTTNLFHTLCIMHQRGLNIQSALRKKEFLYINLWHKKKNDSMTANKLDAMQIDNLRAHEYKVTERQFTPIRRRDGDALVSERLLGSTCKSAELAGFLEFKRFILFIVMKTPIERISPNYRRLLHVMRTITRVTMKRDNSQLIAGLFDKLKSISDPAERSNILLDIGHWLRDEKKWKSAREALEESVNIKPNYSNIRELICVYLQLGRKRSTVKLFESFLKLDLSNPTLFNEAIQFARDGELTDDLISVISRLKDYCVPDSIQLGNCYYYLAQLLKQVDGETAKIYLLLAKNIYKTKLQKDNSVFKYIRISLREINAAENSA